MNARRCLIILLLSAISLSRSHSLQVQEVKSASAQEYLGQFTFFRGWKSKRRLFIVKTSDGEMDRVLNEAVYGYRCPLSLRNLNLVILGDTHGTETIFYHSEDNRRDFVKTTNLSRSLRIRLNAYLRDLNPDLNKFTTWALLLGYDGGRKRMYRKVNFPALFEKIDSMPIRIREMGRQKAKKISCEHYL